MTKPLTLTQLWAKVDLSHPEGCWEFLGGRDAGGYGRQWWKGRNWPAHRLYYALWHDIGDIPEGLVLDHLCRNRRCVRPLHLEPVTNAENIRRGQLNWHQKAKTHCPKGHPYNKENTRRVGSRRFCKTCGRIDALNRYHRKKAERKL